MTKQVTVSDPAWLEPRRCLREPIPEIAEAEHLLDEAANAHLVGDHKRAASLISAADLPAIRDWTESIWGRHNQNVVRCRPDPAAPPLRPIEERPKPRCPTGAVRRRIIARDGYRCRFCGIAVIDRSIRVFLRSAYPNQLRWGAKNAEQHAAFQCMWLQYDHVVPNGRGGESSFENVLLTCAPCNFGRMERTLAQVGVLQPKPAVVSAWDGLMRLMGAPVSASPRP